MLIRRTIATLAAASIMVGVSKSKLDNVTIVEAHSGETGLPEGCGDAILLRGGYHLALQAAPSDGGWAMIHTVVSKEINAPPERVAALYADYEGWPKLFPATIRGVRLLADDGQRKTIQVDHATEGKVINIMIVDSPREIRLEEFKRRFDARFINRFEAAGQGTRYSIVADVQLKGVARVLGPLVTPIVRARLERFVLEPVRTAVERGGGKAAGSDRSHAHGSS